MALPAWGGLPAFRGLEVVDQNLAESGPFSPMSRGQGRRGLSQKDAQVQSLRI